MLGMSNIVTWAIYHFGRVGVELRAGYRLDNLDVKRRIDRGRLIPRPMPPSATSCAGAVRLSWHLTMGRSRTVVRGGATTDDAHRCDREKH